MKKDDGLHYSYRNIDGYNKDFNFIIGPKEIGKTDMFHFQKVYFHWKNKHQSTIFICRNVVDISEDMVKTPAKIIDQWFGTNLEDNIKFRIGARGSSSVVSVYYKKVKRPIYYFLPLSVPLSRLKKLKIYNADLIYFDEFMLDTSKGEKYLKGEAIRFMEMFSTYKRDNPNLKAYFTGNIYSLYNPYFVYLGIKTSDLKVGSIFAKGTYAVDRPVVNKDLEEKLKKLNPLYQSSNQQYIDYALLGKAINDSNIRICEVMPKLYQLDHVFIFENKYLGVLQNRNYSDLDTRYWVGEIKEYSKCRNALCFDFADLSEGSILISRDDRNRFAHFRSSIRNRQVIYQSVEVAYYIQNIYNNI